MPLPLFTDLDGSGVPQIKLDCSDINFSSSDMFLGSSVPERSQAEPGDFFLFIKDTPCRFAALSLCPYTKIMVDDCQCANLVRTP